jgi:hypothetical protein
MMDQMIAWAFVHREYATRYRKPLRSDDDFYDRYPYSGNRRWNLIGALLSGRDRGR